MKVVFYRAARSNSTGAFAGMEGQSEKDWYKNLLDIEKDERAQKRKKKQAALSSSRLTIQTALAKPPQQPQQQQQHHQYQ